MHERHTTIGLTVNRSSLPEIKVKTLNITMLELSAYKKI